MVRPGLRKRLFARWYDRLTVEHEACVRERKRRLFADLRGDVLEIGAGTGANVALLPPGVRWIAVEPNPYMRDELLAKAEQAGVPVELRAGHGEELPAADGSVDAVISTLVLCSVDDPARVLREVRRVLRPGGRFVFLEHVAAPTGTPLRLLQRLARPVWRFLADGCRPDRETERDLRAAGFRSVDLEAWRLPWRVSLGVVAPHVAGVATA